MLHPEAPLDVRIFLFLHIVAGTFALAVAPVAMIVKKGGTTHRRWGKSYVYAMLVVALTSLRVAPYFGDFFLLAIAVFSSYLAFSGWRVLRLKRPDRGDAPALVDWSASIAVIVAGCVLIGMAIVQRVSFGAFVPVLVVLGGLAVGLGAIDIRNFLFPRADKTAWFFSHIGKMTGAYIATVTAFSSVNFLFIHPIWLRWLWPTAAGGALIYYWISTYRARFAKARAAQGSGPASLSIPSALLATLSS